MSDLQAIEEIRLNNLKLLHGSVTRNGGPTSDAVVDFLVGKGMKITKGNLSDIYWRKTAIDLSLALQLERSFDLPEGWLSEDQSFWRTFPVQDIATIRSYLKLPKPTRTHIAAIIDMLCKKHT